MERLTLVLCRCPHIAEELWQLLGHDRTLAYEPWPQLDEALIKEGPRSRFPCKWRQLRAVIQSARCPPTAAS